MGQARNASTLATKVSEFKQQTGAFPHLLQDIVDLQILTGEEYANLQFQHEPNSVRHDWLYKQPTSSSEWAIVSPALVFPFDGSLGKYVVASADGSAMTIARTKNSAIPEWALEKMANKAALPTPLMD